MKFLSATEMGNQLGLSYQKVNKVLAKKGLYDKTSKRPTTYALANNLAEIRSTASQFTGKRVEFNAWDFDRLKVLFPTTTTNAERSNACRSPMDALDKICDALADYGEMLRIEVGKTKQGLSSEAQAAVVQSYFCDPDYLRGTLLFHRFMRPEEADAAMAITLPLAKELHEAARKINGKRAQSNLLAVETTLQWLCDKARVV